MLGDLVQTTDGKWITRDLSVLTDTFPPMSNAASWASTAGNKFRQAAKTSSDPATTLLAEGRRSPKRSGN